MQYRAIATDIDGTLLNENGKITRKTYNAFLYLISTNITIFLCSARPSFTIYPIANKLKIATPVIAYNGAQIVAENGRVILHETHIPPDIAKEILRRVKGLTLAINVYSDNDWYVDHVNSYVKSEIKLVNSLPQKTNDWAYVLRRKKILKFLFFYSPKLLPELMKILNHYTNFITAEISKEGYLEVLPLNAKKSIALSILAKKYQISSKSIIAIGDNYNDADLFQYAGYSIALGNAPEEVQAAANWVSTSNSEDGFFNAIEWIKKQGYIR